MQVGDLVAVYGSLRHGLGNSHRLTGAVRQEDGIISGEFRMVSLTYYPGLVKDGAHTPVTVEVYEVDSEERKRSLDSLEGYPSFYNREQVTLDDGRVVWVYFLENSRYFTLPKVPEGDWVSYLEETRV